MGSLTKKTRIQRMNRKAKAGKVNKKKRLKAASPPFPIHPEKAAAPAKKA